MTVTIKSNIGNRLRKIREGVVYQSVTSVIGELGQNAQRAKAKSVAFVVSGDTVKVYDDGTGCEDPQSVFEMDASGWGLDEAFGEGFFSTFTIADTIEVRSRNWRATVDVEKVVRENDVNVNIQYLDETIEGFEVILTGAKFKDFGHELRTFVQEMGELMPQEVTLNGESVKKKDFKVVHSDIGFTRSYETDKFTASLSPTTMFGRGKVYYESRFVMDVWLDSVNGNIMLKQGAVNLKVPDRREIVYDENRTEFMRQLNECIHELYKEFVTVATDRELDDLADKIASILSVEEYLESLPMSDRMLTAKAEDLMSDMVSDDELLEGMDDLEAGLRQVNDAYDGEEQPTESREEEERNFRQKIFTMKRDRMKETRQNISKLEDLTRDNRAVWVRASEVEDLTTEINELEYYGFHVYIARNRLYERVFEHIGVWSIHDVEQDVEREEEIRRVGALTGKEKRLLWLLSRVERHFDLGSTFRIADLKLEIKQYRNGVQVDASERNVHGLYVGKDKLIYLDRKHLDFPNYRVDKWDSPNVGMHDLRMLMKNVYTIAHELAHRLYGTEDNTLEHMRAQEDLAREISTLY